MVEQPSPEEQRAADAARAWAWERIKGKGARFVEHLNKDLFDKGWSAGYEHGKKGK